MQRWRWTISIASAASLPPTAFAQMSSEKISGPLSLANYNSYFRQIRVLIGGLDFTSVSSYREGLLLCVRVLRVFICFNG